MLIQTPLCKWQEENCAPTKHYIKTHLPFPLHSHSLKHGNFLPPSPPNKDLALSMHLNRTLMHTYKTHQFNAPTECFQPAITQKELTFWAEILLNWSTKSSPEILSSWNHNGQTYFTFSWTNLILPQYP